MNDRKTGYLIAGVVVLGLTLIPAAAQENDKRIVHKLVTVVATNDEWTNTHVKVDSTGIVIVIAEGKVAIGSGGASYDADGGRSNENVITTAELIGKVGTGTSFAVGKKFIFLPHESGTLKLKVYDTQYNDNKGSFTVHVIYLPLTSIPEPEKVAAEE